MSPRRLLVRSGNSPSAISARAFWRRRLTAESLEDRHLLAVLFEHDGHDQVRAIVPSQTEYDALGLDWTGGSDSFDDSAWTPTVGEPNGVGYDRGTAYDSQLGRNVETSMFGLSSTVFVRATFEVADPNLIHKFTLNLRYDDGFIAWLNGVEIARANVDGVYPVRDATATTEHQSIAFEEFDLTGAIESLRAGANVFAIRGLNDNVAGDDALIRFTLSGDSRDGPPLAADDAASTFENTPVVIDVVANDELGSFPIDPASVLVAPPQHGTATPNSDGTVTYTPRTGFYGQDTFTYTIDDDTSSPPTTSRTLVASSSQVRQHIPFNNQFGTAWRGGKEPFDDRFYWSYTFYGVVYDASPAPVDFAPYIYTPAALMRDVNTSIYLRSSFEFCTFRKPYGN